MVYPAPIPAAPSLDTLNWSDGTNSGCESHNRIQRRLIPKLASSTTSTPLITPTTIATGRQDSFKEAIMVPPLLDNETTREENILLLSSPSWSNRLPCSHHHYPRARLLPQWDLQQERQWSHDDQPPSPAATSSPARIVNLTLSTGASCEALDTIRRRDCPLLVAASPASSSSSVLMEQETMTWTTSQQEQQQRQEHHEPEDNVVRMHRHQISMASVCQEAREQGGPMLASSDAKMEPLPLVDTTEEGRGLDAEMEPVEVSNHEDEEDYMEEDVPEANPTAEPCVLSETLCGFTYSSNEKQCCASYGTSRQHEKDNDDDEEEEDSCAPILWSPGSLQEEYIQGEDAVVLDDSTVASWTDTEYCVVPQDDEHFGRENFATVVFPSQADCALPGTITSKTTMEWNGTISADTLAVYSPDHDSCRESNFSCSNVCKKGGNASYPETTMQVRSPVWDSFREQWGDDAYSPYRVESP